MVEYEKMLDISKSEKRLLSIMSRAKITKEMLSSAKNRIYYISYQSNYEKEIIERLFTRFYGFNTTGKLYQIVKNNKPMKKYKLIVTPLEYLELYLLYKNMSFDYKKTVDEIIFKAFIYHKGIYYLGDEVQGKFLQELDEKEKHKINSELNKLTINIKE
jgi:hypothetical protein